MMKCPETRKEMHSQGTANAHLRSLKERKSYNGQVYHCPYCKFWHVGREKKNAHKNKYKKG